MVSHFYPHALPDTKFFQILVGTGELLSYEHIVGYDDDERRVGDGVVGPLGLCLWIFKCVDVLGDSLVFEMLTLHLVLQCEETKGMNPTTRHLEVGHKLPRGNQGVVGLGALELADPHVFDNDEDEFTRFAFYGFISGEVADACLVNGSLPCLRRWLFVIPDGRIIDGRFFLAGEYSSVIRRVRHQVLNYSEEVMDGILLVVGNEEEYLGKHLTEFRKIWVREFTRDGLKSFERFDKEGGNVVRQHHVHGKFATVGIFAVAGDEIYIYINKSIGCW